MTQHGTTQPGRPSRPRRIPGIAAASALALLTAACGSAGGGSSAASASSPPLTNAQPAASAGLGTLTWNLPKGEPASIDPLNADDYSPDLVISNLCDSLFRLNPDFSTSPGLATSVSQPDPLTQIYTIRSSVKFWDGDPLTNQDVAWSLARNLDPNAPSNFLFADVSSITATGTDQVTVKFSQPDELFQKELAYPVAGISEKSFALKAGAAYGTAQGGVMCSGPFKLGTWSPGASITLLKNDSYWDTAWTAHAQKVVLSFLTDSSAQAQALQSGEIDGEYEVPPAEITTLRSTGAGSLYYGPSHQSLTLSVARPDGPLASVKLRQAIFQAIDRPALAQAAYHGAAQANYTGLATNSWDPTAIAAYQGAYKTYATANAYDLDAAKSLVTASGYSGTPLVLVVESGDDTQAQVAQYIQQQAALIGVTLKIDSMQPLQYSDYQVTASARAGTDLLLGPSYNQVADPLEQLGFDLLPGSIYNYAGYNDPAVTADLTKAPQIADPAARAQMILAAQSTYEKTYSYATLLNLDEITFVNAKLTGAITSFAYMFTPSLALIGAKG